MLYFINFSFIIETQARWCSETVAAANSPFALQMARSYCWNSVSIVIVGGSWLKLSLSKYYPRLFLFDILDLS